MELNFKKIGTSAKLWPGSGSGSGIQFSETRDRDRDRDFNFLKSGIGIGIGIAKNAGTSEFGNGIGTPGPALSEMIAIKSTCFDLS